MAHQFRHVGRRMGGLRRWVAVGEVGQEDLLARLVRERMGTNGKEEGLRDPGVALEGIFGE